MSSIDNDLRRYEMCVSHELNLSERVSYDAVLGFLETCNREGWYGHGRCRFRCRGGGVVVHNDDWSTPSCFDRVPKALDPNRMKLSTLL